MLKMWINRGVLLAMCFVFAKSDEKWKSGEFFVKDNVTHYCNRWWRMNQPSLVYCSYSCVMDQDCEAFALTDPNNTCIGLSKCQSGEQSVLLPNKTVYMKKYAADKCSPCPEAYECETINDITLCTKHYPSQDGKTLYSYYRNKCVLDGTLPVRIDSAVKQAAVDKKLSMLNVATPYGFWIQGYWNGTVSKWMFEDGTPLVYKNWRHSYYESSHGDIFVYLPSYKWYVSSYFAKRGILCEVLLQ